MWRTRTLRPDKNWPCGHSKSRRIVFGSTFDLIYRRFELNSLAAFRKNGARAQCLYSESRGGREMERERETHTQRERERERDPDICTQSEEEEDGLYTFCPSAPPPSAVRPSAPPPSEVPTKGPSVNFPSSAFSSITLPTFGVLAF